MSLLVTCALARRLFPPAQSILFIEEVSEAPYRIARALYGLKDAGFFSQLGGVVLGDLTRCSGAKHSPTAFEVMVDFFRSLRLPTFAGLRAGHDIVNLPVHLGAWAQLSEHGLELRPTPKPMQ